MKKIAIFWEKRFENNNFANLELDQNLNPYRELILINGVNNTISLDLLEAREDKEDFLVLCFLNITINNIYQYIKLFQKYPNNQKYFFAFEPKIIVKLNYSVIVHSLFNRIYTWNDYLVDNQKYFKFLYPSSFNDACHSANRNFTKKKFLTLINSNKVAFGLYELYSMREKFIRFAEVKNIEFDLYGRGWNKPNLTQKIFGFKPYISYKGETNNKIETLSQYKFNICFENMSDTPGYITEKIWDSFKARTIPVYWGASNIEQYIPKNCFIDYRDFLDFEKLFIFLSNMTESKYNIYIENIELFLQTQEAKKWFDRDWAEDFLNSLN